MAGPIVFDVDGVLADFIHGFRTTAAKVNDLPNLSIFGHDQAQSWGDNPGLTSKQVGATWDFIRNALTFWVSLPCLIDPHGRDRIFYLARDRDLYFVTARVGWKAQRQTEDWLRTWFGIPNPTVLISKYKGEASRVLKAEYAIDDKADNCCFIAWHTEGRTKPYIIDRPYNQFDPNYFGSHKVTRVETVEEFLDQIT